MITSNIVKRVFELRKVTRQFESVTEVHALVDVDLWLEQGEWLAITGPSGAGKSTLLNIIGCLDRPTSGSHFFDGIDAATLSDKERAGLRSHRIGFVFQSFHLLSHRTVLENVMLAEVYRKQTYQGRQERALAALERVGLSHRVDFLPTKLSGGEMQRVAIARALVGTPSLLLCDEPTGNLDSKSTADLLDLFEALNRQGLTLVVVSHDENVAKRAGRRVHIIDGSLTHVKKKDNRKKLLHFPKASEAYQLYLKGHFYANKGTGEALKKRLGHFQQAPDRDPTYTSESTSPIPRSGMMLRDLFDEVIAGMFARPGRMMLTVLGIVIGLTALVATANAASTFSPRSVCV